jgi:hypothetical protein
MVVVGARQPDNATTAATPISTRPFEDISLDPITNPLLFLFAHFSFTALRAILKALNQQNNQYLYKH